MIEMKIKISKPSCLLLLLFITCLSSTQLINGVSDDNDHKVGIYTLLSVFICVSEVCFYPFSFELLQISNIFCNFVMDVACRRILCTWVTLQMVIMHLYLLSIQPCFMEFLAGTSNSSSSSS